MDSIFTYIKPVEDMYVQKEVYDLPTHTARTGEDGVYYDLTEAVDFLCDQGASIKAARGGVVKRVIDGRTKTWSEEEQPPEGFFETDDEWNGNYIVISHEDGYGEETVYCHLKPGSINVKEGQDVSEGDIIGLSGHNGWSRGPHLHFCVGYWETPKKFITRKIRWRS